MNKLIKQILIVIFTVSLAACNITDKENPIPEFDTSTALSVIVNNGDIGLSIYRNKNYAITHEYWINNQQKTEEELKAILPNGSSYNNYVENNSYEKSVYRNNQGEIVDYKFARFYNNEFEGPFAYFKNEKREELHNLIGYGSIYGVDASSDKEVFAGFVGTKLFTGLQYQVVPTQVFYHKDSITTMLPLPSDYKFLNGVNAVHYANGNVYVSGAISYPMYWENNEVKKLHTNKGVVNQIFSKGNDIYAVGSYSYNPAQSEKSAACYWINGEFHKVEENAVANSIFVTDTDDIYVAGAIIDNEGNYEACYWVNGEKVIVGK